MRLPSACPQRLDGLAKQLEKIFQLVGSSNRSNQRVPSPRQSGHELGKRIDGSGDPMGDQDSEDAQGDSAKDSDDEHDPGDVAVDRRKLSNRAGGKLIS